MLTKKDRKRIGELASAIDTAMNEIREIADAGRAEWDEKSERWQDSDKGQDALAALDNLDTGLDELDSALSTIRDVAEGDAA